MHLDTFYPTHIQQSIELFTYTYFFFFIKSHTLSPSILTQHACSLSSLVSRQFRSTPVHHSLSSSPQPPIISPYLSLCKPLLRSTTLLAWKRDSNWWRRTPSKGVLGDLCIQVWFNFRLFLICFLGFDLFAWSQIDCLCNLFTAMGLDWGFVLWSILLLQIDIYVYV
jgi:hypothetical protein